MRFLIFFLTQKFLLAFNGNLTAVHYSTVSQGIDEDIKPGICQNETLTIRKLVGSTMNIRIEPHGSLEYELKRLKFWSLDNRFREARILRVPSPAL